MGKRKIAESEHNKRMELYKEGLSDYKIAFILKYSKTTIQQWRNRYGLSKNNTKGRKSKIR